MAVQCKPKLTNEKCSKLWINCILVLLLATTVFCRRHKLSLEKDTRKNVPLSTFGFLQNGILMVKVSNFSYSNVTTGALPYEDQHNNFLFSLEKTASDGASSYLQSSESCRLNSDERAKIRNSISLLQFSFNIITGKIDIQRFGSEFQTIIISKKTIPDKPLDDVRYIQSLALGDKVKKLLSIKEDNRTAVEFENVPLVSKLPLTKYTINDKDNYSGVFTIAIRNQSETGLYNLYFQNCKNYNNPRSISIDMELSIIEFNDHTYLSAGELHLPVVYGLMSLLFFGTACFYVSFLKRHREWTFKIHYLMASLVFLKSIALAFHATNFYYIGQDGSPVESWAVLYYVTHLLKGALLFTTIVLIGTGFFFVKHVLSSKEKHIFMIVIPLQIISNVANIMIESTEEGTTQYMTWKQIFILLDLICCGAILFPIVWSIQHLQHAAETDGKAAISLAKLKLFRHFYIMIVCYIYFTRILVYLIKITVPFQYMWLDEFFTEMATFVFFVVTGYNFRPAPTNPYLHVPAEDEEDDVEMTEISTQSGFTEGVTRVGNRKIIET